MIRREFTQAATAENPTSWGFEQTSERGAIVYAIMWRDTPEHPRTYFGMVFLTERKKGEFAYKDISEDCGPYYYGAPLNMIDKLDKLAPATGYAANWRESVRNHHARNKEKAKAKREARANLARFVASHFQVVHIGA
jgi:hypothetical protein